MALPRGGDATLFIEPEAPTLLTVFPVSLTQAGRERERERERERKRDGREKKREGERERESARARS